MQLTLGDFGGSFIDRYDLVLFARARPHGSGRVLRGWPRGRQDQHREHRVAQSADGDRGGALGELQAAVDDVKPELDSLSEMGEMESLRLQMAMDRMSKLRSTLSNILKKSSKTSSQITQNIK